MFMHVPQYQEINCISFGYTFYTYRKKSSSSRLPPQGGRVTLLHSTLSLTLSKSTTLPSSRIQSIHRFLGRPLLLVPGSLRSIAHLTSSFTFILFMCPYHLSLLSQIFSLSSVNSCLMFTFLILSCLVTPPKAMLLQNCFIFLSFIIY